MLSFQCQNLVVDVRCLHIILGRMLVGFSCLIPELLDLFLHCLYLSLSRLQLKSHDVNLFIEFVVLTHSLVEEYFLILQTVLEGSPGDFFLMYGSFVGDFGLYLLFNLIQNLLLILVLILEDQEVLLLVLKQSSEHVSLPLKSLSL